MANEPRIDPRNKFAPHRLPWLLAAAALLIYCLTLNHWVSLLNLGDVSQISGWMWQPDLVNPLTFLVTYPFRWLPAGAIPLALNLFSAVCAAATLGLLARSVALLPHDRTPAERAREHSDFSFLSIPAAWLPPVLAVVVCGLEMTFWENATNNTGEMFDMLLFAFIIWSLLEYRLDEREGRLLLAAIVYGAGMANNWAMIGFFPIFIAALIWIRGFSFFYLGFLSRMFLYGLAGISLYLLLPLVAAISHKVPVTFWEALKTNLVSQWQWIKLVFMPVGVRGTIALLSLTSLLPVFVMAIRWKSSTGDSSKLAASVTSGVFHVGYTLLLCVCVWVAFDPPYSPRHLGFHLPCLTFYYLGALAVGYSSGYLLLIFGKEVSNRFRRHKSPFFQYLNRAVVGGVWLVSTVALIGLLYKNGPPIHSINGNTFEKYTSLVVKNLPRTGAILLSDDPRRLFLVEAALAKDGRAKDFIPLDTEWLASPVYHQFLHREYPKRWPDTVTAAEQTNGVSPLHLIGLLATLAKTNELYYLHPSFGYYFEEFYMEPHGLVYRLKTLPNATLLPPLPDKNLVAENQQFWTQADDEAFAPIEDAVAPSNPNAPKSWGEWLLTKFHVEREQNPNLAIAGTFYSHSLDFWGVQLQREGDLTNAATSFELAQKLNPDNVVAGVNLAFNQSLRAGQKPTVNLSETSDDNFGKYKNWSDMLNEDGPFDQPSYCLKDALILMHNLFLRQAVVPLERVRELVPDNLAARLLLGQIYLASRLPDRALDVLRDPMTQPEKFSLIETNETRLNILAAAAYFQKNDIAKGSELLQTEISRHPTNTDLLTTAMQVYLMHGLYTNALHIIDRELKLNPDDPNWIFSHGYAAMQMKDYPTAIADMSRVLTLQSTNNNARFNRAIAYLESGKLDAARADYKTLQQTFTNSFQVAYGLGEIAWRQHNTNEAIRNYEIYMANANTNTAEAKTVRQRLRELKK